MLAISSSTVTRISGMEPGTLAGFLKDCGVDPFHQLPGFEEDPNYPGVRLIHERMPDGSWAVALEVPLSHDFGFRQSRFYQQFQRLVHELHLKSQDF